MGSEFDPAPMIPRSIARPARPAAKHLGPAERAMSMVRKNTARRFGFQPG